MKRASTRPGPRTLAGGVALPLAVGLLGCCERSREPARSSSGPAAARRTLADARRGFEPKLTDRRSGAEPPPAPPPRLFSLVTYPSPAGDLAAYLTTDPGDGKRHPAIVWVEGGLANDIGSLSWEKADPAND